FVSLFLQPRDPLPIASVGTANSTVTDAMLYGQGRAAAVAKGPTPRDPKKEQSGDADPKRRVDLVRSGIGAAVHQSRALVDRLQPAGPRRGVQPAASAAGAIAVPVDLRQQSR